jgi:hypothetical protein
MRVYLRKKAYEVDGSTLTFRFKWMGMIYVTYFDGKPPNLQVQVDVGRLLAWYLLAFGYATLDNEAIHVPHVYPHFWLDGWDWCVKFNGDIVAKGYCADGKKALDIAKKYADILGRIHAEETYGDVYKVEKD